MTQNTEYKLQVSCIIFPKNFRDVISLGKLKQLGSRGANESLACKNRYFVNRRDSFKNLHGLILVLRPN